MNLNAQGYNTVRVQWGLLHVLILWFTIKFLYDNRDKNLTIFIKIKDDFH